MKDGGEVVRSEQHEMKWGLGSLGFEYEVWLSLGKNVRVGNKLEVEDEKLHMFTLFLQQKPGIIWLLIGWF